ncbi:MAG: radical SAM protein [Polyangiaceae bacterium]|nr:radical SAM protein [Polyangiaceae bacterium]
MNIVALFENGTPEAPGAALDAYRGIATNAALLRWYVDPANVGLLCRAIREFSSDHFPAAVEIVLRAEDVSEEQTLVHDESELVPTLRRLHRAAGPQVRLQMTNGRSYVLPPPALDISTNALCGLSCSMCDNRVTSRDPATMSSADVRRLMDEAAAWGIGRVALTGAGEPLRDSNMLDHIEYANALGHMVTITTNGFPVSEKVAEALAERTVSVSVSIHGATEETHEAIVGVPKAGEKAWQAIGRLVRAKRRAMGSKLSVNVSTVIQRQNFREIPALVRRAREEGCDGINTQPINLQHGSFRGDDVLRRDDLARTAQLWPDRAQHAELEAMFDELDVVKREVDSFMHASPERLSLFRRYFRDSSRAALGITCRVGETFLAVDHRGQIKPCYRLPWSHGDARLVHVQRLWNSRAYARTRRLVDACPLTCMNNCFFRSGK